MKNPFKAIAEQLFGMKKIRPRDLPQIERRLELKKQEEHPLLKALDKTPCIWYHYYPTNGDCHTIGGPNGAWTLISHDDWIYDFEHREEFWQVFAQTLFQHAVYGNGGRIHITLHTKASATGYWEVYNGNPPIH